MSDSRARYNITEIGLQVQRLAPKMSRFSKKLIQTLWSIVRLGPLVGNDFLSLDGVGVASEYLNFVPFLMIHSNNP